MVCAMVEHPNRGLFGAARLEFATLPSTNQWCLDHTPLPHGTVVTAEHQTAGHGRFERPWLAIPGKSLAMSIVLHIARIPVPAPNIGQCAALAVRTMLERDGLTAKIKWPNDVMVNDRKIGGILAEQGADTGSLILGIGLNLNITREEFVEMGLESVAISMALVSGTPHAPDDVCAKLINAFDATWRACTTGGMAYLRQTWWRHDWLTGRELIVSLPGGERHGHYAGIDDAGALVLADRTGTRHTILAGDVRHIVMGKGATT